MPKRDPHPLIEDYTIAAWVGAAAGLVTAAAGLIPLAVVWVLVGTGVSVAFVDLVYRRIPTPLVVFAGGVTVAVAAVAGAHDASLGPVVIAAAGAGLVGGVFLVVHLVTPAGLGFGDVRLAAVTGALTALGADQLTAAAAAAGVAAVAATAVMVVSGRPTVAFGPYLIAAAIVAVAAATLLSVP